MLSMAEYMGNMPALEKTKSADVSFFNVFGYRFIYYPSSLNLYLIIATTILFIFNFIYNYPQRKAKDLSVLLPRL